MEKVRIFVGELDGIELNDLAQKERRKGTKVFVNFEELKGKIHPNEISGNDVDLLGGTASDCLPKTAIFLLNLGAKEIRIRAEEIRLGGDDLFPACNLELRRSTIKYFLPPNCKQIIVT